MSTDPLAGPIQPFPEDVPVAPHTHDRETYVDPVHQEVETHVDPAVADAVHHVRDRFGARGLRDLITLATYELEVAETAFAALNAPASPDEAQIEQAFVGYVQEGQAEDDADATSGADQPPR